MVSVYKELFLSTLSSLFKYDGLEILFHIHVLEECSILAVND